MPERAWFNGGWFSGGILADETFEAMGGVWSALSGRSWVALVFGIALMVVGSAGTFVGLFLGYDGQAAVAAVGLVLGLLLQLGLWGTLRDRVIEGHDDGALLTILGDAGARMPRIALMGVGIVFVQSVLACLPGLVILALSPMLYLTAAWPDASWRTRLSSGLDWLKVHGLSLVTLLGVVYMWNGFVYGGLYAFGMLGYSATPYIFQTTVGLLCVGAGALLAAVATQLAYFVVSVSTFIAMERASTGDGVTT